MCGRVSRPVQVFSPTIARAGRIWRAVPTCSIEVLHFCLVAAAGRAVIVRGIRSVFFFSYSNRARIHGTPTDGESTGLPAAKHPVLDNSDCSREASSTWSRLIIKSPKRICCCARAAAACASSLLLQIPAWWIVSCGIGRASARKPRILLNQGRLLMLLKACCNNSGELTDAQMSGWRPDACSGKVCIHPRRNRPPRERKTGLAGI